MVPDTWGLSLALSMAGAFLVAVDAHSKQPDFSQCRYPLKDSHFYVTIKPTWPAGNISLRQWITIYIWYIPALLHHTFGHHPTTHYPMVKQNVLWILLNMLCTKQRRMEQQQRRYLIYFSFSTEKHEMLQWKMECLQQKQSWGESSGPH